MDINVYFSHDKDIKGEKERKTVSWTHDFVIKTAYSEFAYQAIWLKESTNGFIYVEGTY